MGIPGRMALSFLSVVLVVYGYATLHHPEKLLANVDSVVQAQVSAVPQLRWKVQVGSTPGGDPSPAIAKGMVYVARSNRTLTALNAQDGQVAWQYTTNTGGSVSTSPVVGDDLVLFGVSRLVIPRGAPHDDSIIGYVFALDAATGQERWRFELAEKQETTPVELTTPVIVGDTVYFGTSQSSNLRGPHGGLYALNLTDGALEWKLPLNDADVRMHPVAENGLLYFIEQPAFGARTSQVRAIDTQTHQEQWRFALNKESYSNFGLIVSTGIVSFVSSIDESHVLYALDPQTGKLKWSYTVPWSRSETSPLEQRTAATAIPDQTSVPSDSLPPIVEGPMGPSPGIRGLPTAADGSVLFAAGFDSGMPSEEYGGNHIDVYFLSLSAQTGKERWRSKLDTGVYSRPAVDERNIYFATLGPNYLYSLDRLNGLFKWRFPLDDYPVGPPIVADGVAYVQDLSGNIYALSVGSVGAPEMTATAPATGTQVGMPRAGEPRANWPLLLILLLVLTTGAVFGRLLLRVVYTNTSR
ncbi:MAG: PQQ-binding-like beta-propeller repeat protein [Chloroflexota bacterium]|nr:PQQ-binding-like beta-propeller repeat protein [Chloroflexota bacterium]